MPIGIVGFVIIPSRHLSSNKTMLKGKKLLMFYSTGFNVEEVNSLVENVACYWFFLFSFL